MGASFSNNPLPDLHWKAAYDLFDRAIDLAPLERLAFLDSQTQDPDVHRLVLGLLDDFERGSEAPTGLSWQPGHQIDRYQILGKLGEGGMGCVFSAHDTDLQRVVALKVLAPSTASTPVAADRLVREARAASLLNHPHIVTIYEVIRTDGEIAIAMELVEGESLRAYCREAQPAARVIEWGRQIAQALATAAGSGIVHRDIKPENLMVRADGYIKVLDFGLARRVSADYRTSPTDQSSLFGGTLFYMSPEQIRTEPATGASDVFSLGIVLYELAAGSHPFPGETAMDRAQAILHGPSMPAPVHDRFATALMRVVADMLAKDPAQRPSAAEVERRLAHILAPQPVSLPNRRWLALAAVGVLLTGALALWILRDRLFGLRQPVLTQVTAQATENSVTSAAISPDGRTLAFAAVGGSVYLRTMPNGLDRPLDSPAGIRVNRIAWFRDQSRLLVSGYNDGRFWLWAMPVDGRPAELLIPDARDGVPSPDGARIAFTTVDGSSVALFDTREARVRSLHNFGTGVFLSSLFWSPDGNRINSLRRDHTSAQAVSTDSYSYQSIDADRGLPVTSLPDIITGTMCGLDDGRVLFLRLRSPDERYATQLWGFRTDLHTGRILEPPRPLLREGVYFALLSLSASLDGSRLSVLREVTAPNVHVADLQPGSVPHLSNIRHFTFTTSDDYPHAWTADSRAVIFESGRGGHYQLYRQDLDRRDPEPLVASPLTSVLPQLTPDHQWILYRNGGARLTLMRVPASGGDPAEVMPLKDRLTEFVCATHTSSRCVLRSRDNNQVVFHELDPLDGKGRELTRTDAAGPQLGDWGVSPNGQFAAFPNHSPSDARIRILPLGPQAASPESTLTLSGLRNLNAVSWSHDGKGFYISAQVPSGWVLAYAGSDGKVTILKEMPGPAYVVPSPDGRHIAFPQPTASNNVWTLSAM